LLGRVRRDLVNRRVEEVIAIEERSIKEQEAVERVELLPNDIVTKGLSLNLSLGTWSTLEDYRDEF
jgi:hypothetical protein